ncbi:UNVERIFIED_ORG: DnaB helicase-like protein [Burkholderia sp. CF145]
MNFENDLRTRAEKLVLSALLQDNGSVRHIAQLKPAHFSHDTHGQIFRAILALIAQDEPADQCSVFSWMDRCRQLRRVGLFGYLCDLAKLPAIPANIGYYACALTAEELVSIAIRLIQVHTHGLNDPGHRHGISDPGHSHGISDPGHSHGCVMFGIDLARER